jgi:hypothetical protein
MNFYDSAYQELPTTDALFGLCDDRKGRVAYIDKTNRNKWIAIIHNKKNINLLFTAIDKGVIKDDEEPERGRCDGMLASNEHIYFVELKDQRKNWISDSITQLESTIQFFIANHDIAIYKHKKAFACNKRHPQFKKTENELNLHFFKTYGVRLGLQADIVFQVDEMPTLEK